MLELTNLRAGYGKKEVLHGVTASFERGCLTCVIGPNGCGKSTLLKAVLAILPPAGGEVTVDGAPISLMQRNEIARRIAYLAQAKNTPDMTVGQMVLHGRFPHLRYPRRYTSGDRAIVGAAMEQLGIAELAERPMASLSGGMQQRAYIAMALAQDTEYILLDEPTTYLDIGHQCALMEILRGLANAGKGIVAVMHDLPLAFRFSDSIVVMNDGAPVAVGTPEQFCRTGIIESVFGVTVSCELGEYYYRFHR